MVTVNLESVDFVVALVNHMKSEIEALRVRVRELTALEPGSVEEAMTKLSAHFGQPVMPVSKYCEALRTWAEIASKRGIVDRRSVESLEMAISKSSLLDRLIYGGEKLRTKECPQHKGEWHSPFSECPHGCNGTGWLPEPTEPSKANEMPASE